jgi:hypothetical protein
MRRTLALLALASFVPEVSHADQLSGTKDSLMFEKADGIELRLAHGHATLVVRRTFENRSVQHDQAQLHIEHLPEGAVATGLRTLGGPAQSPVWFAADLMDAEVAAKRYEELTGIGGYYPKDPALLSWRSQDHLALQVFPVAPKSQKTVEYTLVAPTTWVSGRYELELPRMGLPSFAPTLTVKGIDGDRLLLDGVGIESGDTRKLLGPLTLAAIPKAPPKLGGRFASVTFAKGRSVVHTAIEASSRLSEAPKEPWVLVLLDGSRSLSDDERRAELDAAKAYLSFVPDARVQLLVFDRAVHPLEASFVTTAQALADLKKLSIQPRNGSDLDVALADAQERIAEAPIGAPRRMLLLTDLKTRSTLVPERIKGLEHGKTVLHVATVTATTGGSKLRRDDHAPWSVVPRSTGGVLWDAQIDAQVLAPFEEWVRPLRIDRVSLAGSGLVTSGMALPDTLAEGEGFEELHLQASSTPSVEVQGELWSTPIRAVLSSNAAEEKLWAGLTVGSSLLHGLKDPEIAALAFKGGVVSPMTSYLAVEPGVRPSTEGLERGSGGLGLSGIGAGGGGFGFGLGGGKVVATPHRLGFLRAAVGKVAAACGATTVRVRLETTRSEIVAVDVAAKLPLAEKAEVCVRDGVFALELPSDFDEDWASWDVGS